MDSQEPQPNATLSGYSQTLQPQSVYNEETANHTNCSSNYSTYISTLMPFTPSQRPIEMTEISATAVIKTGAPISVFNLNGCAVGSKPSYNKTNNFLLDSTRLLSSSPSQTPLQVGTRKTGLSTPSSRQNLDRFFDRPSTYEKYDGCIKLEEQYENAINGLDENPLAFMFHPVQKETMFSASSLSEDSESSRNSTPAKKPNQKVAKEIKSEQTEPTGLVQFRVQNQHCKKKGGLKYPPLISPLGYEYLRHGTGAIGLDVYVCSKRRTSRCQARVNMNHNQNVGQFTDREHNHCSPYYPFNPQSKAHPRLRPGAFKARQQQSTKVITGDTKPEWDEPPGHVQFDYRQSAQKNWRGGVSRLLISKKGYEYRRRKVLANGISEYACNRKSSEPYCSVRLEIRNDENFGVFAVTQHNHPPKYQDRSFVSA